MHPDQSGCISGRGLVLSVDARVKHIHPYLPRQRNIRQRAAVCPVAVETSHDSLAVISK